MGNKWGELGELPAAKIPVSPIIADFYVDVPIECGEMRSSILSASDFLGVRLYFKELPEIIGEGRPALRLTCPYCVYQQGNPGWHHIALEGYATGKEPVKTEMLWHANSLEHRAKLLSNIRLMAKILADKL